MTEITNTTTVSGKKEAVMDFTELRREASILQKKGAPFMMASVVIWTLVAITRALPVDLMTKNMYTFYCPGLLLPCVFLFSKIIGAHPFAKLKNPFNRLGFLCTMNQMLYLLIVMWAFNQKPEAMMMLFAMVFGGHLLPYSWVYNAKPYIFASIIETIGVLIIALAFGNVPAAGFMIIMQLILCILLFRDLRKDS